MYKPCIYKLNFNNTDKVYIGQALDVSRRLNAHKNKSAKGSSPKKLQHAFDTYGLKSYDILIYTDKDNLCTLEDKYILEYDSIKNGFNSCMSTGKFSYLSGEDSVHSKYSRQEYISVFEDLAYTDELIKDIAAKYSVSKDVVQKIALCLGHYWLKDEFPETYELVKNKIGKRQLKNPTDLRLLVSPEGEVFEVDIPLREFARIHDITDGKSCGHLGCVLNGTRKSYKGWTKYYENK